MQGVLIEKVIYKWRGPNYGLGVRAGGSSTCKRFSNV